MIERRKTAPFFSLFFGEIDLAEIKIRGILLEGKERINQHSTAVSENTLHTDAREDGSGMERSRRFERERH